MIVRFHFNLQFLNCKQDWTTFHKLSHWYLSVHLSHFSVRLLSFFLCKKFFIYWGNVYTKEYFLMFFKKTIFGCAGSSLLCAGFAQRAEAALHCSAQASRCGGCFCCGAQTLERGLSRWGSRGLECGLVVGGMGLAAPQHGGSSWTRNWNRVPLSTVPPGSPYFLIFKNFSF